MSSKCFFVLSVSIREISNSLITIDVNVWILSHAIEYIMECIDSRWTKYDVTVDLDEKCTLFYHYVISRIAFFSLFCIIM